MITAKEVKEQSNIHPKFELPDDWLARVLIQIDSDIKYHVSHENGNSDFLWRPVVEVRNIHWNATQLLLDESQRDVVRQKLKEYGFVLSETKDDIFNRYKISW